MPLFEDLSKKMSGAAKTAAKKSGDLVETTKLNRGISNEENKIGKIYTELGKTLYNKYKSGEEIHSDFIKSCEEITEIEKEIGALQQKIMDIKNLKTCPNCNYEADADMKCCPKCGTKLYKEDLESAAKISEKKCPSCGTLVSEDTLFCSNCGQKI